MTNESSLKMMKNDFCFILKDVLKIIRLFLDFLIKKKNGLIREIRLISKFMTSQPGKKYILPSISRSKGNPTKKFGQLTEYNMRNIFFKNHTQNMVEKLFPDHFPKDQN